MSLAKIGNKIFKKEVELSKEKLELAGVKEIASLNKSIDKAVNNVEGDIKKIESAKEGLKKSDRILFEITKQAFQIFKQTKRQAEDLGINYKDIRELSELEDLKKRADKLRDKIEGLI